MRRVSVHGLTADAQVNSFIGIANAAKTVAIGTDNDRRPLPAKCIPTSKPSLVARAAPLMPLVKTSFAP